MKILVVMTEDKLEKLVSDRITEAQAQDNQNYEREILLKQANLATLQGQINPHFLYNTLECIRGMALLEDAEDVADIAWSLSNFFRYSISGNSDIVTLKDELENVRNYIKIQQYRFKDRFSLEIFNEPEVKDVILPKLTLQPVVENAILHGLSDVMSGGTVSVTARRIQSNVQIMVSDNGCGMTPEQLEFMCSKIRDGKPERGEGSHHTGIGMQNVDKRLKLHFGQEYGISIYSCEGLGTDVEILIPYKLSSKE